MYESEAACRSRVFGVIGKLDAISQGYTTSDLTSIEATAAIIRGLLLDAYNNEGDGSDDTD